MAKSSGFSLGIERFTPCEHGPNHCDPAPRKGDEGVVVMF